MPVDVTVNGAAPELQLRIAAIGLSIRSEWKNPAAATHRAVGRALMSRGHAFTFFEERLNDAITGLYREQGSAPLRTFNEEYADLHVRSYDPPHPRELGVWLGQIASIHDLIMLLQPHPGNLFEIFETLQAPHVVRLLERRGEQGSFLENLATGAVVTPYDPLLPVEGDPEEDPATARARLIEQAWIAAGIRF